MNGDEPSGDSLTFTRVTTLWAAHTGESFPDGLRWADAPSGAPVPALDFYAAGCVNAYLAGQGVLDPQRHRILTECAADLEAILPGLTGHDATYVARLIRMAELITHPHRARGRSR
ncbi:MULTISPECIES: hypothetical protein [Streptomyces]|uniref:hypothetical protein n=1 Tax=Streptomyces TaxID=1883 RepID=UPI00017EACE0|nr:MULTISPECIES: hypothetical protein [Streptomyces]EDX21519.1 hypothetical protein SSAG_01310 [Streptomyces sp. Mg1]RPK32347.1 hypothetical protein EES37_33645 [Streptomyces sp. ADI91-18]WBY23883.1 hypothetical protein PET44_31925 [Streptomyces goshikiensis]WSS02790.1 hypothetical protein OG224_34565 [Streptomyces goshikiensis]WSX95986.1 hypothetical protein OG590_01465 [Streptomyces goshikiensis]